MEGHQEEQEAHAQHEDDHQRHLVAVPVGVVHRVGGFAGNVDLRIGERPEVRRDDRRAEVARQVPIDQIVRSARNGCVDIDHRAIARVVDLGSRGIDAGEFGVLHGRGECLDRGRGLRPLGVGNDDFDRQVAALRPLGGDEIPGPNALDAVWQSGHVARRRAEPKLGDGSRDEDQDRAGGDRRDDGAICGQAHDRGPDSPAFAAVAGEERDAEAHHLAVEDRQRGREEGQAAQDRDENDSD